MGRLRRASENVVLPLSIDAVVRARETLRRSHPRLNLAIVTSGTVVLAIAAAIAAGRSGVERSYPAGGLAAVRRAVAADPSLRVFADERYADCGAADWRARSKLQTRLSFNGSSPT